MLVNLFLKSSAHILGGMLHIASKNAIPKGHKFQHHSVILGRIQVPQKNDSNPHSQDPPKNSLKSDPNAWKKKAMTNYKNVPIPILDASVNGFYIPSKQKSGSSRNVTYVSQVLKQMGWSTSSDPWITIIL